MIYSFHLIQKMFSAFAVIAPYPIQEKKSLNVSLTTRVGAVKSPQAKNSKKITITAW